MELEVISRESIKPSSPTPPHLKTFKTSVIDKIVPSHYGKFISFYAPNHTKKFQNLHKTLKESLSKSLTIFYPFAGRISDDGSIDCNDNGVLVVTTHVNCTLVDLLASPKPKTELFYKFSPPIPPFCPDDSSRSSLFAIQVNEFICGGIAICICFNHFFIDAMTNAMFVKCWSETAAKNTCTINSSIYPAVSLFPQGSQEPMPDGLSISIEISLLRDGRGTMKRFVFEDWAISKLKEKAKSEHLPNPTRVEALTGFMWKHLMDASEVVWGCKQPSILSHAVDLRPRLLSDPTSAQFSVGNIAWKAVSKYHDTTTIKDAEVEKELAKQVRESITKIKDEFVPKILSNGGYYAIRESMEALKETCSNKNLNPYTFSSWCRTGLIDADFGWGKPVWVSFMGGDDLHPLSKHLVMLMDGGTGDRIEAWVTLDKQEMKVLENNPEFLAFASLNPPILLDS